MERDDWREHVKTLLDAKVSGDVAAQEAARAALGLDAGALQEKTQRAVRSMVWRASAASGNDNA